MGTIPAKKAVILRLLVKLTQKAAAFATAFQGIRMLCEAPHPLFTGGLQ